MKTAAVEALENQPADLLALIKTGEEVLITHDGRPVATLRPVDGKIQNPRIVNWSTAPEATRKRENFSLLDKETAEALMHENRGCW